MRRFPIAAVASALTASALLAACSGEPVAPSSAAVMASQQQSSLHFGSSRYRDRGAHPWRGASGSAAVEGEALVGNGGVAILTLRSYRASDPSAPAGEMKHIVLRAYSRGGRVLFVRSYGAASSAFTAPFSGLAPGSWFAASVEVTGLDGRRTDVVKAGPITVVRGPDLAVTAVSVPGVVVTGTPTILSATVAELGGQRGATGDCVLSVDGVVVDQAAGIWVDAGDAVSCAFSYSFPAAGAHSVLVRMLNVDPSDTDPSNNAMMKSVTVTVPSLVVGGGATVSYGASVISGSFAVVDSFTTLWTDQADNSLFLDARDASSSSGTTQDALFTGIITTAVTFPLVNVEVRQSSGGVLLAGAQYQNVPPDAVGGGCISRGVGTGVEFYLCSDPLGFSAFTYRRAAGTVTYQSATYLKVWNGATYDVATWVDNGTTLSGPMATLGASFGFDVRITDASGTYVASTVVPLAPSNQAVVEPSQCSDITFAIALSTYNVHTCTFSSYVFSGVAGSAAGSGVVAAP
jgi:hypothetical protein